MAILVSYNKFIEVGTDINDIKCFGGTEYSEIQKLGKSPKLDYDDFNDVLIDLYLLSKEGSIVNAPIAPKRRGKKRID